MERQLPKPPIGLHRVGRQTGSTVLSLRQNKTIVDKPPSHSIARLTRDTGHQSPRRASSVIAVCSQPRLTLPSLFTAREVSHSVATYAVLLNTRREEARMEGRAQAMQSSSKRRIFDQLQYM